MKATFWLIDLNNLSGLILDLNMMIVQFFFNIWAVIKRTFSQSNFWTRWNSTYKCMTTNLHLLISRLCSLFRSFQLPASSHSNCYSRFKILSFHISSVADLVYQYNEEKNLGTQLTWLKSSIFLYFLFYCRW